MARIRTVKPGFFRHEGLQDLARQHGAEIMLVFEGLWTVSDSKGRFEWRPRTLKLDILPFLEFEMEAMLATLAGAAFVVKYTVDGRDYGEIPTFLDHQRITGKEVTDGEKYPPNPDFSQGINGETLGKQLPAQEGERELGKGKGKETHRDGGAFASANSEKPLWALICEIWGFNPATRSEFKRIEALFRDFTQKAGEDLQAIRDTVRRYRKGWKVECTPEAVLKHWDRFQEVTVPQKALPQDELDRLRRQEADEQVWQNTRPEERESQWQKMMEECRRAAGVK